MTVSERSEHPCAVDFVTVVLCVENTDACGIDGVDLCILRVNVIDSVAEHTDSRCGFHSLPYEVGGVEVCADGIAYSLSQLEKSFGIVAAEAGVQLKSDLMYMMLLRELYGFLPVGDEDFVPLIIENSEEVFRPRASYPSSDI